MRQWSSQWCGLHPGLLSFWEPAQISLRYQGPILNQCLKGRRLKFALLCWSDHTWHLLDRWLREAILFQWLIQRTVKPIWQQCQFESRSIFGLGHDWFWWVTEWFIIVSVMAVMLAFWQKGGTRGGKLEQPLTRWCWSLFLLTYIMSSA